MALGWLLRNNYKPYKIKMPLKSGIFIKVLYYFTGADLPYSFEGRVSVPCFTNLQTTGTDTPHTLAALQIYVSGKNYNKVFGFCA